jgi:Response regulators consisting of a CheY-like receiver domain and a winged-helix DNA-binding domain
MRILLIEDEAGLVRTLKDLLARRGYTVEAKMTGEEGLATAMDQEFDLILLDVMLPGIDGFEVCRRIRRAKIRIPILMLTARGQISDKVLGFEGGADDYVTKPFDPDELLARIGALLRRASFSKTDDLRSFEFDGKRVDFVKSQLIRDGKPVDLSERESRLLRYFIEHKGEIITRETLLQEVWGYQAVPLTRTVDVHIVWLRQKIEEDPRNPRHILTVHGQGYRFSA